LAPRVNRFAGLLLAVMLACGANAHALAEPPARETLEETAARCVARLALIDLRIVATPTARDYQIAQTLLEIAHGLAPADEITLRQLIECAENAGDAAAVLSHTRTLVELDPADTVAQLRLISSSIRSFQNADDRLAAYDRWLGSEGSSVDVSVRSRLALDAALLAREKGDVEGFARRLGNALALDATNKDAAVLALAFYQQRVGDPVGQFELMLAVLNADPLDVDLHRAIARHLVAHGAFKGAERFFGTVGSLLARLRADAFEEEAAMSNLVLWMNGGPRSLVDRYKRDLFETRQAYRRQREEAVENKRPPEFIDEIPTPEEVRITMANEWVRFLAAIAVADEQAIDEAFDEFIETARQESEKFSSSEKRPKDVTDEEATARIRGLLSETTLARLIAHKDADKIAESLDILRADSAVAPQRLANLEGWNLMRKGEHDAAERQLKPIADSDPIAALGLCFVAEAKGDNAAAAAAYESLARRESGQLPGALAASRYQTLTGNPLPPTEVSTRLDSLAMGVPTWLEPLIENPRRIQAFDAILESTEARALDPVHIKITLRNTSPIPLGVGSDGPIDTGVLISPNVQIGTQPFATGVYLQVVSMEHRLRLLPREEFSTTVNADVAALSLMLEELSGRRCRLRYQLLQGFMATSQSTYDAGPFSLTAECGPLTREFLAKSAAEVPALIRSAGQGSPRDVVESIFVVRGRALPLQGMTTLTPDELTEFHAAVAAHLPGLSTTGQLLVLSSLAPAVQSPEVAVIDEAARKITDPAVRKLFIATRAGTSDDPVFADPATQADASVRAVAERVKERLDAKVTSYATFNGGMAETPTSTPDKVAQPPETK